MGVRIVLRVMMFENRSYCGLSLHSVETVYYLMVGLLVVAAIGMHSKYGGMGCYEKIWFAGP